MAPNAVGCPFFHEFNFITNFFTVYVSAEVFGLAVCNYLVFTDVTHAKTMSKCMSSLLESFIRQDKWRQRPPVRVHLMFHAVDLV